MLSKSLVGLVVGFACAVVMGCGEAASAAPAVRVAAVSPSDVTEVKAHVRHVPPRLQRFDANHDGVLQQSEVPARLQGWFAKVDANKDGIVTAEEIRAWNRAHRHHHNPQQHTNAAV
jgi:hypothetical protein